MSNTIWSTASVFVVESSHYKEINDKLMERLDIQREDVSNDLIKYGELEIFRYLMREFRNDEREEGFIVNTDPTTNDVDSIMLYAQPEDLASELEAVLSIFASYAKEGSFIELQDNFPSKYRFVVLDKKIQKVYPEERWFDPIVAEEIEFLEPKKPAKKC